MRQNRLENRTSCNSFSPDVHVSGTFERHATQWDTLIFKGEHWRLVEDRHGQVGYAPAAFLVVIIDTTEEESDATKKGQENSTEENRIGQEGERRKSYSAAVIDGIKRNSNIEDLISNVNIQLELLYTWL